MSTATSNGKSPWKVTALDTGGENQEIPPPDNYPSVLIGLIDLGTHLDEYQGKQYENRKVLFAWELVGENKADGQPFVMMQDFNFLVEMGKKSRLRMMLEGWRGGPMADSEDLDLEVLLGKPCLVNVVHGKSAKGNIYAKIDGVKPIARRMAPPVARNQPYEWHFGSGRAFTAPSWLPFLYGEPVADVIARAHENRPGRAASKSTDQTGAVAPVATEADDDIPF